MRKHERGISLALVASAGAVVTVHAGWQKQYWCSQWFQGFGWATRLSLNSISGRLAWIGRKVCLTTWQRMYWHRPGRIPFAKG